MRAGDDEENKKGERRRLPKLKNPAILWNNRRQQSRNHAEEDKEVSVEEQQQEALQEVSRKLIIREEQLFSQDHSPEEEDRLQKDFEDLKLQLLMAFDNTFTSLLVCGTGQLDILRSAVASIQQQEVHDHRWVGCPEDRCPVWRPLKFVSAHNALLQNMVESRLTKAVEDEGSGGEKLSSPVKREVFRLGKRVKDDLLVVVRMVKDCYPPQMDILNVYAALYHQRFSARLTELSASGLEIDDCSYVLHWVNHCYPDTILKHEDLKGQVKTACLGSLLLPENVDRLEGQYLSHREDEVKLWLSKALEREEDSWLRGLTPETIDTYCFSPLAMDVIQMMDSSLTECSHVIRDQSQTQRITAHLGDFLSSYRKSLDGFMRGNHSNIDSVIKAQLVCEEQFRDYISEHLFEQQRRGCLDVLSALRDCGYRHLIGAIHSQLKVWCSHLWTSVWLDGSLPVVDSLLNAVSQQQQNLNNLKTSCKQSLLCTIHEDIVLCYVRKIIRTRTKSKEQQLGGAERMKKDVAKINDFFRDEGCSTSLWLGQVMLSMAEVLRLQDPGSIQLEMVSLARTFPDLDDAHVLALLSLKTGLSATDVRSIRRSVTENRLLDISTNHSPPFFSKIKVKWFNNKINQMGL